MLQCYGTREKNVRLNNLEVIFETAPSEEKRRMIIIASKYHQISLMSVEFCFNGSALKNGFLIKHRLWFQAQKYFHFFLAQYHQILLNALMTFSIGGQ